MDWTYEEYIEYVNHLFMQEFVDFEYRFSMTGSTQHSLEVQ